MKILYPLYVPGFVMLPDDENKEAETSGKEMLFAILYLNNSDKYRFPELKKRVKTTTF